MGAETKMPNGGTTRFDAEATSLKPSLTQTSNDTVDVSIVFQPCDLDAVPGLMKDISFLAKNLDITGDRENRLYLLEKARSLVHALETPREAMFRHLGEPPAFFHTTMGVDIGLFHEMAKNNGSPKKVTELSAALKGFNVDVLRRALRHLAAMGRIVQTGPDEYKPNNYSKSLTIGGIGGSYQTHYAILIPAIASFSKWMRTKGYTKCPDSIIDNPFTFGHQTDKSFFEFVNADAYRTAAFNNHMVGYGLGVIPWMDPAIYPVSSRLIEDYSPGESDAMLVDIGGSVGHDVERFAQMFPSAPGRLVLQDMQSVLDSVPAHISSLDRVELVTHDFFTPQPVRGARAYYLHHILHDWPDDRCEEIIGSIREAMTPGYSKLLVHEHVIPAMNASYEATYLDQYMMCLFGARERTEEEWRALLEGRCGLKILGLWGPGNGIESVIECELVAAHNGGEVNEHVNGGVDGVNGDSN